MGRRVKTGDSVKLSKLDPDQPSQVLDNEHWWRLGFLRAFLDWIDLTRVDDPERAFRFAEIAPLLATRVPIGRDDWDGYRDGREALVWLLYARVVLAAAARAVGRTQLAEDHFDLVRRRLERVPSPPSWLCGAVSLRYASYVFLEEGRHDEGLRLVEVALGKFRDPDTGDGNPPPTDKVYRQGLASAYTARGVFRALLSRSDSFADFTEAMHHADRTNPRGRKTYDVALKNLLIASSELAESLAQQGQALQQIRRLLASMSNDARLRRLRLQWAEGRLLLNLGLEDEALKLLTRVRKHLIKKHGGSVFDIAMLSLDIGRVVLDREEHRTSLGQETLMHLQARGGFPQLEAAVLLLLHSKRRDELARVQQKLFRAPAGEAKAPTIQPSGRVQGPTPSGTVYGPAPSGTV